MKKIFASIAVLLIAAGSIYAQDLAAVTELFNNGAAQLSSDKAGALKLFEQALTAAEALGEEGQEIAGKCKENIPTISLAIAKDFIKESELDKALTQINAAIEVAKKFASDEIVAEAEKLIPQVLNQKAGTLLNNKEYAAAAEVYKQILAADETNGTAALRLGVALNGAGDAAAAKAAFEQAAKNGQAATANKQLSNMFLKDAAAALKAKKFADAVAAAVKVTEYDPKSAQAFQIAGQASQLGGKNADAIKYFEKYLELAPTAKNAGAIAYTVGALYQTAKNNAKAKEFYTKASTDPQYGAEAKKLLETLK